MLLNGSQRIYQTKQEDFLDPNLFTKNLNQNVDPSIAQYGGQQIPNIWDTYTGGSNELNKVLASSANSSPQARSVLIPSAPSIPLLSAGKYKDYNPVHLDQMENKSGPLRTLNQAELLERNKTDNFGQKVDIWLNGKTDKYGDRYGGNKEALTAGLNTAKGIWDIYNANRMAGIAEDTLDFQKKAYADNQATQKKITNKEIARNEIVDAQMNGASYADAKAKTESDIWKKKNLIG